MTPRALLACAALLAGCATPTTAPAGAAPTSLVRNDNLPRLRTVAVVVDGEAQADVISALRDRAERTSNLTREHELLHDDEALAGEFGRPLPFAVAEVAAQAWRDGSAACAARAGRAPAFRNEVARRCAHDLGSVVWELHVAATGVDTVLAVRRGVVLVYAPGSTRLLDDDTKRGESFRDTLARVMASTPHERDPSLVVPTAPVATDPLLHGAFGAFEKNPNAGCGQPLPASLAVEGASPLARAVESAWLALPERPRTGPQVACRVNASGYVERSGDRAAGAWLDCAAPLLPVSVFLARRDAAGASTGSLAELLVDRAVTDVCKYER